MIADWWRSARLATKLYARVLLPRRWLVLTITNALLSLARPSADSRNSFSFPTYKLAEPEDGRWVMFCNKCGAAMDAASQFCPRCGAAAPMAAPVSASAPPQRLYYGESKLSRRIPVLATLWVIYGVLELIRGVAIQFFVRLSRNWLELPFPASRLGTWVLGWVAIWSISAAVLAF